MFCVCVYVICVGVYSICVVVYTCGCVDMCACVRMCAHVGMSCDAVVVLCVPELDLVVDLVAM